MPAGCHTSGSQQDELNGVVVGASQEQVLEDGCFIPLLGDRENKGT
jgi:hypothetical protein